MQTADTPNSSNSSNRTTKSQIGRFLIRPSARLPPVLGVRNGEVRTRLVQLAEALAQILHFAHHGAGKWVRHRGTRT
jgi:hypothetical protein